MIMAICPKFGIRGEGVTVGVTVGASVEVGGSSVEVSVTAGTEGIRVGGADVVQATSKTINNMPNPERFIKYPFIQAAFSGYRLVERA
jgi:hypothetical protein